MHPPLDLTKIDNIDFDGINYNDAPDFADAYIASADYDGRPMTEAEIEAVSRDAGWVYERLIDWMY